MTGRSFHHGAGQETGFSLLPTGSLFWAIIKVKNPAKASKAGGQYIDLELILDEGQPYANRRLFTMIMDPFFEGNSEKARQMGMAQICRILETGRGAGPANMAAYQMDDYIDLNGLRVGIKIGFEKGTGGYEDKNTVAEYVTPNPDSKQGKKLYDKLMAGDHNLPKQGGAGTPAPSAQAPSGFGTQQGTQQGGPGAPAPKQPAQGGGFGASRPTATGGGAGASTASQGQQTPNATPQQPAPSGGPDWLQEAQKENAGGGFDDEVPF